MTTLRKLAMTEALKGQKKQALFRAIFQEHAQVSRDSNGLLRQHFCDVFSSGSNSSTWDTDKRLKGWGTGRAPVSCSRKRPNTWSLAIKIKESYCQPAVLVSCIVRESEDLGTVPALLWLSVQLQTSHYCSEASAYSSVKWRTWGAIFLSLVLALTTWCDGLRRCLQAGRSHRHSNRGTGPWAHSLPSHPGRAPRDRSNPLGRARCIPHPGKRGSGRSCCKGSHTAGTPDPVGSSELGERERKEGSFEILRWQGLGVAPWSYDASLPNYICMVTAFFSHYEQKHIFMLTNVYYN